MKCKLSDICSFRKGKVEVENLNAKNYISTENMLPNKCGITKASSLPTVSLTQEYKNGDVLVSNIRPYFKKIWQAQYDGGCSNDVLVFVPKPNIDKDFLYYVLADDDFFTYSMATSKGTKMPRGDKTSIMQYEVPMIDLQEQKKIASVLKALDKKIELNNEINNNLFYLRFIAKGKRTLAGTKSQNKIYGSARELAHNRAGSYNLCGYVQIFDLVNKTHAKLAQENKPKAKFDWQQATAAA